MDSHLSICEDGIDVVVGGHACWRCDWALTRAGRCGGEAVVRDKEGSEMRGAEAFSVSRVACRVWCDGRNGCMQRGSKAEAGDAGRRRKAQTNGTARGRDALRGQDGWLRRGRGGGRVRAFA
jgi:hypothetical protein